MRFGSALLSAVVVAIFAGPAGAVTFTVTNTNADGAGSLAAAITSANATTAADVIEFDIGGVGLKTISAALPPITEPVTINGYTQTGAVENTATDATTNATLRIALSGASLPDGSSILRIDDGATVIRGIVFLSIPEDGIGVEVSASAGSTSILGCFIGTTGSGTIASSNGVGIDFRGQGSVGTSLAADRNLISGNKDSGIEIRGNFVSVRNNLIGSDRDGDPGLGNAHGILVVSSTANVSIGGVAANDGNHIVGNDGDGIRVLAAARGVAIERNFIEQNGALGIDLGGDGVTFNDAGDPDDGANAKQNFPDISFVRVQGSNVKIQGSLESDPGSYQVEFFRSLEADESGFGEGARIFGSTTVVIPGGATSVAFAQSISVPGLVQGQVFFVTATAQANTSNDTSEFSPAVPALAGGNEFVVTNTNDSGAGSLREALASAKNFDGPDAVVFGIPGTGPHSIEIESELLIDHPVIVDGFSQPGAKANTLIGTSNAALGIAIGAPDFQPIAAAIHVTSPGVVLRGLAVHSAFGDGILAEGADGLLVQGCHIGSDANGEEALGNAENGIRITDSSGVVIGGAAPGLRNLISSNVIHGVDDDGIDTSILNNAIGTDVSGELTRANGADGIHLRGSGAKVGSDEPGFGNRIRFNGRAGVAVNETGDGNTVLGNAIDSNNGLGIDLAVGVGPAVTPNDIDDADVGANGRQNFPVITILRFGGGEVGAAGLLDLPPSLEERIFALRLYASESCDPSGKGEGARFLGAANDLFKVGEEGFEVSIAADVEEGDFVTATATDPESGNTSEFSSCFEVGSEPPLCGDANDDETVTASDALFALKAAVGTEQCEDCVCDVNDSGSVTSSDALFVLRRAVGQALLLTCPACL